MRISPLSRRQTDIYERLDSVEYKEVEKIWSKLVTTWLKVTKMQRHFATQKKEIANKAGHNLTASGKAICDVLTFNLFTVLHIR